MNKADTGYKSTYGSRSKRNTGNRKKKTRRNLLLLLALFVFAGILFSKGNAGRFFIIFAIELAAAVTLICFASYFRSAKRTKTKKAPKSTNDKNVYTYPGYPAKKQGQADISEQYKKRSNFDWVLEKKDEAGGIKEERQDTGAGKAAKEERTFVPYRSPFEPINPVNKAAEPVLEKTGEETAQEAPEEQIESGDGTEGKYGDLEPGAGCTEEPGDESTGGGIGIIFDEPEGCFEEEDHEPHSGWEGAGVSMQAEYEDVEASDMREETAADCEEAVPFYEEPEDMQEPDALSGEGSSAEKLRTVRLIKKAKGTVSLKEAGERHKNPVNKDKADILLPSTRLLRKREEGNQDVQLVPEGDYNAKKLIETLASFGVGAKVINVSKGPAVTRYELQPNIGVKVSKIVNLADDIALNLAATAVRIEAPIPGKAAIGIEIPNKEVTSVLLRDVIESEEFQGHSSKLAFAVGKDISGGTVVADIAKMPHLLIAGATGSGKSVCINTLIASILYKATPSEVKLLMIDPKVVELNIYNGIPHLLIPVVTDPKKAAGALNWAIQEMVNRYKLFADNSVRDLKGYNNLVRSRDEGNELPHIVIIIDELADLMMVAPNDVEDYICRLAQMARAAGMHLVIATQRPSVDVITGVIKANIPSRISFAVTSQVDSRTILDMSGAEKLLGRGDMLFNPIGEPKPKRVQGAFISDKEVEAIVEHLKANSSVEYDEEIMQKIDKTAEPVQADGDGDDELLQQAIGLVIDCGQASSSLIQRKFKVGYARAARIVDQMEAWGVVSSSDGSRPRKILVTKQEWEDLNA